MRRRLGARGGDVGEFFAPIEAFAGEQADLAAVEPSLNAITVELDLVRPATAARRNLVQGGERRRHEIGQAGAVRPQVLVLAPAGVALACSLRFSPIVRGAVALLRLLLPPPPPDTRASEPKPCPGRRRTPPRGWCP